MGLRSDTQVTSFKFSPAISSGLRLVAAVEGVSLQETSGEAVSEILKHLGKGDTVVPRATRGRSAAGIVEAAKTIIEMKLSRNDAVATRLSMDVHRSLGQLALEAGQRMNTLAEQGAILLLEKKKIPMARDIAGLTSETARKKAMTSLSKIARGKADATDFFFEVTDRLSLEWWQSQPDVIVCQVEFDEAEEFPAFVAPAQWMPEVIGGVVVKHIPARKTRERRPSIIVQTAESKPETKTSETPEPEIQWGVLSAKDRPKPVMEATVVSEPAPLAPLRRSPTAWRAPDTKQKADNVFKTSKRKVVVPTRPVSRELRASVQLNRPKLSLAGFRKSEHT